MDWSKFTTIKIWIYFPFILNDNHIHKDFSPASREFVTSFLCLGQKLQLLCGFTIIFNFHCQQLHGFFSLRIFIYIYQHFHMHLSPPFCEFVNILFRITDQHHVDFYSSRYDKPVSIPFISLCVFRDTKTCIIYLIGLA